MTRPDDAVARYLRALDRVDAVVDAVPARRWDAPTACPGWSARQLLGHLVDGQHQVLAMLAGEGPRAPVPQPQLAATGMYAAPVPVPDDAPAQDLLLAALGRRPPG